MACRMDGAVLAVGVFGRGGTLQLSLPDIPLRVPSAQDLKVLRLDIGATTSVPDHADSVLFLELRPITAAKPGGKPEAGPAKYWTCSPLSEWRAGPLQLQLYKAPPVYAIALQRNTPKLNSFLQLTIL
jgi:hypothetical protein